MRKPSTSIAFLGALAVLAVGCGSSNSKGTTQAHQPSGPAAPTATTSTHETTAPSDGNGGTTAPTSPGGVPQPNPSGPATLSLEPSTAAPGRTVTVTLHAPAGTHVASVTLAGTGGSASAVAKPSGGAFVATLVVPQGIKGGFWPVVARYGASSETNSVTAQLKVFTP